MLTNLLEPSTLEGLGYLLSPVDTEEAQDMYSIIIG